jgi:hypothetical protein
MVQGVELMVSVLPAKVVEEKESCVLGRGRLEIVAEVVAT